MLSKRTPALALDAVRNSEIVEGPGAVEFITSRTQAMGLRGADFERNVAAAAGRSVKVKLTIRDAASGDDAKAAAGTASTGTPAVAEPDGESPVEGLNAAAQRALANPEVQRFQELFPDSKVRGVRDLKE